MQLLVLNREKTMFDGEVRSIYLPGDTKGDFQMLDNHMPIIVALRAGNVVVVDMNNKEHTFSIHGGIVESNSNRVTILAD